jgi:hypothetical protein
MDIDLIAEFVAKYSLFNLETELREIKSKIIEKETKRIKEKLNSDLKVIAPFIKEEVDKFI